jgi:hypothetical protein
MQSTMTRAATLEETIPEDPPHTIIKANVKTARVRLKKDYWPIVKITKGERLYAGQTEPFPIDEARKVVENRAGELVFDDLGDNEVPASEYGKIPKNDR